MRRCANNLFHAYHPNSIAEGRTIRCIPVPQQVAGRGVPGKGLGHLTRKPDLCRIFADIEVDDLSAVMAKHDQGIQDPKRRGCNNEHVDRRDVGLVVVQEASPGRGGDFRSPRQVSPDCGLADFDAELEQFAVDAGRAPERVGEAHLADQIADLGAHLGPSRTAHGCRLDQHHGIEDLRPNPVNPNPEKSIRREEPNPTWVPEPQDAHLMSKGQ